MENPVEDHSNESLDKVEGRLLGLFSDFLSKMTENRAGLPSSAFGDSIVVLSSPPPELLCSKCFSVSQILRSLYPMIFIYFVFLLLIHSILQSTRARYALST